MSKVTRNLKYWFVFAAIILALAGQAFAQDEPPAIPSSTPPVNKKHLPVSRPEPPEPAATPMGLPVASPKGYPAPRRYSEPPLPPGEDYESSLIVDPKVNIAMCVKTGNVKVNGWDRNEIRIFIKNGSALKLNVREKSPKSGQPVWVTINGMMPEAGKDKLRSSYTECIWGDEIEIDVPHTAAMTVKGQETTVSIESLRKTVVQNAGGNITLRSISESIDAKTYEGDITVSDCEGMINLENTSGNILAFNLQPGDIGDGFKAKTTSGKIFLQQIEHRQTEASSISGAIMYDGKFQNGGQYRFFTTNGGIVVTVPVTSSFTVVASYGYGGFYPDPLFKLETMTQNNVGGVKVITAKAGTGDATLNITTNTGVIKIKKL